MVLTLLLAGCGANGDTPPMSDTSTASETGHVNELTVPTEDLELEGTLRLPTDEPPATVVIVPGSGPQSRDGRAEGQLGLTFPSAVPVYRELAEHLVAHGYGAVSWDKRTCGAFNDCADNAYPEPRSDIAFDDLVDDTTAVLDVLTERDDLGEIVLLGHSQGGTIAAAAAEGRGDLAGLVLLATPEPPIDDVLHTQAETLAELVAAAGQSGGAADAAVLEVQELADEVTAIADGELAGPPVGGAAREFWAGWVAASRAAPEQVAGLDVPVLVIGGERDWNVLPEQVTAWEDTLDDGDELVVLPGVTHALTHLGSGDVAAITVEDLGVEIDDSVPDAIAAWLSTSVIRARRTSLGGSQTRASRVSLPPSRC